MEDVTKDELQEAACSLQAGAKPSLGQRSASTTQNQALCAPGWAGWKEGWMEVSLNGKHEGRMNGCLSRRGVVD